ncbi:porin [uncultured Massilia sp.]|uniref:porin n=1 Tax=uncultured Massilia sp. TaxID=169973 RepID=UPI0025E9F070|nr:porin [uncultured Massilia sp.]
MPTRIRQGATCVANVAALAALCAASAHAQQSVTIYGRLNVSMEHVDNGSGFTQTRMVNNRSVLGFRGSEDLGGGVTAIFQLEGTLSPDTGAGEPFRRDTRVGLDGPWGTLFAGHWVTAYAGATSGLDPFYPTTAGYMSILANGSGPSVDNVGNVYSFDRRQANSVHYWTPAWHGLSLRLTHGMNEEKPASGARPSLDSAAAVYERGPWYAVLAHERHHEYQGPGLDDRGSKIALAYQFGPAAWGQTRVAAIVERLEYGTASGELARDAAWVAVSHQMGAHGLRLSVGRARAGSGPSTARIGYVRSGPGTGATHVTLGYDYTLSKRSSLYAYVSRLDNGGNAAYDFPINGIGPAAGATLKGMALGMRHNF